jgi:hypothetical protein
LNDEALAILADGLTSNTKLEKLGELNGKVIG